MKPAAMSPAQVRARAALAFRNRQRGLQARRPHSLEGAVLVQLARLAPQPMRSPFAGETPLSELEVAHGIYHGIIAC